MEDERSQDVPGEGESDDGVVRVVVDGEVVLGPGVVVGEVQQEGGVLRQSVGRAGDLQEMLVSLSPHSEQEADLTLGPDLHPHHRRPLHFGLLSEHAQGQRDCSGAQGRA